MHLYAERSLSLSILLGVLMLIAPAGAHAGLMGGMTSLVRPCYNNVIYANVGPPRGGQFIWSSGTITYPFGPPRHGGQWLLGLTGGPYFCIVEILPLTVWPGILITMMGSSQ